jgi:hypothetical protein
MIKVLEESCFMRYFPYVVWIKKLTELTILFGITKILFLPYSLYSGYNVCNIKKLASFALSVDVAV